MRTILSHLFTAFVVYWACGIYIVNWADQHSNMPFMYKLQTSFDWPYKFYIIGEHMKLENSGK